MDVSRPRAGEVEPGHLSKIRALTARTIVQPQGGVETL
jgi:hypothetical protein